MRHPLLSIVLAALLGAPSIAAAQVVAFRTEVFPIATVDLRSAQVLRGERAGPPAQIAGELRLPITDRLAVPAVIFFHGDAGQVNNQIAWIDAFNALGIAVFTVDSYSGRGLVSGSTRIGGIDGADKLDGYARMADVYAALTLLSRHPRIDAERIAIMGVSTGGRMALNAAMPRFSELFAAPGTRFAAHIALYPDCNVALRDETRVGTTPIRLYIGAADNVTAAEPCRRYVDRLRAAGADIAITEYAGAHHGFDNVIGKLNRMDDAYSAAHCSYAEQPDGSFVNADTGVRLVRTDACVTRGFTAGGDAAGAVAVRADVARFLGNLWRDALPAP